MNRLLIVSTTVLLLSIAYGTRATDHPAEPVELTTLERRLLGEWEPVFAEDAEIPAECKTERLVFRADGTAVWKGAWGYAIEHGVERVGDHDMQYEWCATPETITLLDAKSSWQWRLVGVTKNHLVTQGWVTAFPWLEKFGPVHWKRK